MQEQARQEAYDLMKQKPRWTLEMLTACLAILCVLLMLVLLVQRPAIWPVLVVLAAAWCIGMGLWRRLYKIENKIQPGTPLPAGGPPLGGDRALVQ